MHITLEPPLRFDHLITRLKERDYRLTPQRMELMRLIVTREDHPNASRLYEQIKARFPTISLATVYKTLDLLKELGEVLEIGLHDDNHYDGNRPYPHPHLICTNCQKIIDGDLEIPVQAFIDEMEQSFNFHILRHQLNFYGLCSDCKNIDT